MATAVLAAGCGGATEQPESITGQASTSRPPAGTYEVIDISGASQAAITGVDAAQIKLTFGAGTLTAATGCNTLTGRTRLDGHRFIVSDLNTTDLPCAEPFVVVQRWLVAFFEAQPTFAFNEKLLTLTTTQATIRLRPTGSSSIPGTEPGSGQPSVPRTAGTALAANKDRPAVRLCGIGCPGQ